MKANSLIVVLALACGGCASVSVLKPETGATVDHIGRKLTYYTHTTVPAWGAANTNQTDSFAVLEPKTGPRPGAPLYVVLHSAGHALQSCLDCLKTPHNHDIYMPPADFYALFVDCKANAKTDWWWGQNGAGFAETPVEKRVMETIAWTIQHYGIDPNRVYLSGNSMGGSGTLGIGLRHGDVFAAIKANVPAGTIHCSSRMGFGPLPTDPVEKAAFEKSVAALPEPPVLVDYSAPNDGWSKGHNALYDAMSARKYAILGFWGDYGHANNDLKIALCNDIIHDYAWTNAVKNAAYPVFTQASSDTKIDFEFGKGPTKKPGQVNGFFRWRNVEDSRQEIAMELRLVTDGELKSKLFKVPETSTANVAIRRRQKFAVKPGDKVAWTFGAAQGVATVGADGLLDVGRLTLTQKPTVLRITHAK